MKNVQTIISAAIVVAVCMAIPAYAAQPESCANKVNIQVNGLVCDFCARSVEKLFGERAEVTSVKVNLDAGQIDVDLKAGKTIDDLTLNKLIKDSGFDITKIKRGC